MLKELFVNIPLMKYLKQIAGYAEFMKNLVTKNLRVSFKPANNMHYYSSIDSQSFGQKKEDLKVFPILCTIGQLKFCTSLCDL